MKKWQASFNELPYYTLPLALHFFPAYAYLQRHHND